ncbi:MAG TPA: DNA repair protein RecO C-terminal domain-containing protein, partial [Bacteroidia bacterium]|nr:DNA repair protein RecO C-terminal domain-containing protein [Bacteroidia bacterium]
LRKNYLQTLAASYFVKLIDQVAEDGTPLEEIADLLDRGLDYLESSDADLRAVLHFEKQLASYLGVSEPGTAPYRCIGSHFGGIPSQRDELMARIG